MWNKILSPEGLALGFVFVLFAFLLNILYKRYEINRGKDERQGEEELDRIASCCEQHGCQNLASLIKCAAQTAASNDILLQACARVEQRTSFNPLAQAFDIGVSEDEALEFLKAIAPEFQKQLKTNSADYATKEGFNKIVAQYWKK